MKSWWIRHAFSRPAPAEDSRPFWLRLISSLRINIKPGKTFARPINEVTLQGKAEF